MSSAFVLLSFPPDTSITEIITDRQRIVDSGSMCQSLINYILTLSQFNRGRR
jgi:hypothetical protein